MQFGIQNSRTYDPKLWEFWVVNRIVSVAKHGGFESRNIRFNPNQSLEICVNYKDEIYSLLCRIFSNDGH